MSTATPAAGPQQPALAAELRRLIDGARQRAAVAVNAELTLLYWQVGERIHRNILGGLRAGYGEEIVAALGRQLGAEYGRGWSARTLRLCIRFAQAYPDTKIVHTLCAELKLSRQRRDDWPAFDSPHAEPRSTRSGFGRSLDPR